MNFNDDRKNLVKMKLISYKLLSKGDNKDINNEIKNIKVLGINKDYSLKVKTDNKILNLETGEISFHI